MKRKDNEPKDGHGSNIGLYTGCWWQNVREESARQPLQSQLYRLEQAT